jgi:hypothetical protein
MFLTISLSCHKPVSGPLGGFVPSLDIAFEFPPDYLAIMHWQQF